MNTSKSFFSSIIAFISCVISGYILQFFFFQLLQEVRLQITYEDFNSKLEWKICIPYIILRKKKDNIKIIFVKDESVIVEIV